MRTIELADGITATIADHVSDQTIGALRDLATTAVHRDRHGYLAGEPLEIADGIEYENRDVGCAACGAWMPHAPWPTNSTSFTHRPTCGKCGSAMTFPKDKAVVNQAESQG